MSQRIYCEEVGNVVTGVLLLKYCTRYITIYWVALPFRRDKHHASDKECWVTFVCTILEECAESILREKHDPKAMFAPHRQLSTTTRTLKMFSAKRFKLSKFSLILLHYQTISNHSLVRNPNTKNVLWEKSAQFFIFFKFSFEISFKVAVHFAKTALNLDCWDCDAHDFK